MDSKSRAFTDRANVYSPLVGFDNAATRKAQAPYRVYVRESRRIKAEFTVREQHVGVEAQAGIDGAEPFADSVDVGSYRIDLHPTKRQRTYVDISSWPFQIPMDALVPVRMGTCCRRPRTSE